MNYWNYRDSIDLEYFLRLDDETPEEKLHERDRNLYLQLNDEEEPQNGDDNLRLLYSWLAARRKNSEVSGKLPGSYAVEVFLLLKIVLIGLALFSGFGAGLAYFSYSGDTPVNVLPFLLIFVLLQCVLTLTLIFRQTIAGIFSGNFPKSALISLLALTTEKLFAAAWRKARNKMHASQILSIQDVIGKGKAFHKLHARVFYWPLFTLLQGIAVMFNIGLLSATMAKVAVSDIAFGWQSTLQLSSEFLHRLTSWIALPWSWFIGQGVGYPTLEEVEGSRIILKEGIEHLATENLISWWPFLLMCVLFYSLLPRLIFLFYGKIKQKRITIEQVLLTPAVAKIIRRMQTPVVTSQAMPEPKPAPIVEKKAAPDKTERQAEPKLSPIIILLPDDCFDACPADDLASYLEPEGFMVQKVFRYQVDYETDQQLLENFAQTKNNSAAGIMLLAEAWMPPLMDLLTFVKSLRSVTNPTLPIRIRLVGRPDEKTILTPVSNMTDESVWQQKIRSLGDPFIEVSPLITGATS